MSAQVIYLTGWSGFIGTNLRRSRLASGSRIVTVGRGNSQMSVDQFCGSRLESDSAIVHLAGLSHDLSGTAQTHLYEESNVQLTEKIFDAFAGSAATSFVFISSVKAVADETRPGEVLDEFRVPHPTTDYGVSKLRAEARVSRPLRDPTKRVYVLRPALVTGPGVKGNLQLLDRYARSGLPYPLGVFINQRSTLYVENLRFVVQQAIAGSLPAGTYHVADDQPLSSVQMLAGLAGAHGKQARVWHIPEGAVRLSARIGDWARLPLNSSSLSKLTGDFLVSNQKLRRALDGQSLPFSSLDGIRASAQTRHDSAAPAAQAPPAIRRHTPPEVDDE